MGEAWTFGPDPAELTGYLRERGLDLCEDLGIESCRERWWGARGARMRGYEFYRIARARVSPPPAEARSSPGTETRLE